MEVPEPRLSIDTTLLKTNGEGRTLGSYDPSNKLINIYAGGNQRYVVKHEFIHYLRHLKNPTYFYSRCSKPWSLSREERKTRKMVCRSWKNIKLWFNV